MYSIIQYTGGTRCFKTLKASVVDPDPHPDPHPHQTKIPIRIRIK
jgi:hypothetical protein